MASFTRRMRILGHALTGDRAGQPRAGQVASAASSWELFLKDFGAKITRKPHNGARIWPGARESPCVDPHGIG